MRSGQLDHHALPDDPVVWTDADWFKCLWDKILPRSDGSSGTEAKARTENEALEIAIPVYNNFVVHKALVQYMAPIRATRTIREDQCKWYLTRFRQLPDQRCRELLAHCVNIDFFNRVAPIDLSRLTGRILPYDVGVLIHTPAAWLPVLQAFNDTAAGRKCYAYLLYSSSTSFSRSWR